MNIIDYLYGCVQVGDIVQVLDDEEIFCDFVVLFCDDLDGICYIIIVNFDGEINFKVIGVFMQ